jgi:hypothetical protein
MKRTSIFLLLSILALFHQAGNAAGNSEFPQWIHDLRLLATKTLQTEVSTSPANLPDAREEGKLFLFCLKGHGSLREIPDPFETMERMFSKNSWKSVPRYQADGHGSSSFAYEKGDYLCNIYVNTDSSCDDEETGHIPSEFWFEIYCREK